MGGRLRVLLVHSSSGRYGADRQLALLATGLDRQRFEPIVVLPEPGELAEDLATASVEVIIRPLSVLRRELMNPHGLASLGRAVTRDGTGLQSLVRQRGVGLVHSNTSAVLGGAVAAALARVPHVWHVREIYSRFGSAWPAYRRVLLTASALSCVSQATAAQFWRLAARAGDRRRAGRTGASESGWGPEQRWTCAAGSRRLGK